MRLRRIIFLGCLLFCWMSLETPEILAENKSYEEAEIIRSKYSNPDSWFLPIHQDEMDQNDKLVQNPYYINQ